MLLFDCHVHIGRENFDHLISKQRYITKHIQLNKNTIKDYIKICEAKGITKCLAFPFPFKGINISLANKYMLNCQIKEPTVILPLLLPENPEIVESHIDVIYGIKEHFYLDTQREILLQICEILQNKDKLLLIHAHNDQWKNKISEITYNFNNLKILIAHSARRMPFSSEGVIPNVRNILSLCKNKDRIYVDTSTIRSDYNILRELIKIVSDDNILFGSDFPFYKDNDEDTYERECNFIILSKISDVSKEKIFNKNFRALFQTEKIWIRRSCKDDYYNLIKILDDISEQDKKFLAIKSKKKLIEQEFKRTKNVFIAESRNEEILGFLRKTDRPNNGLMIEEIYVLPMYRNKGIGKLLIKNVIKSFDYVEMKTFASNILMNNLSRNFGFKSFYTPKKTMIHWRLMCKNNQSYQE